MGARENTVHIEGNLATEPELRFTSTGMAVTTLVVAHSDRRMIDGQWTDGPVSYFDCAVFGSLAEHAIESLGKGSRVAVDGQLRQRSWADKATGEKRYKIEVVADLVSVPLRFGPALAGEKAGAAAALSGTSEVESIGQMDATQLEVEPY